MTGTHSTGPWKINKNDLFDGGYHRKTYAIVDANNEPVLLFDPSQGEYYEALEIDSPDAQLIASAPDLLDALQEIIDAADSQGWNQLDPSFSKARAAIAKATVKSL